MVRSVPPGPGRAPSYLRTASTPRMLVLLVVLLAAAAVCARLGVWQLDRAQLRGEANARAQASEIEAAPPVPLAEVLQPQSSFAGELVGHKVVVSGTFGSDELLVPGRSLAGRTGYLVLTPLLVDLADADAGEADAGASDSSEADADAGAAGGGTQDEGASDGRPVLAVVRGWVEDRAAAVAIDPAPAGTVEVTGYLQTGEAGGTGEAAAGEVDAVSPGELVNRWGGPIYSAYLVVSQVSPPQDDGLALLPPPTVPGGGVNLQNLAYALQWWIFGGFAVLLWVRLVRDETRAAAEELAAVAEELEAASLEPTPPEPTPRVTPDRSGEASGAGS